MPRTLLGQSNFRCSAIVRAALTGMALLLIHNFAAAQVPKLDDDEESEPQSTPDNAGSWVAGKVIVNPPVRNDQSAPLPALFASYQIPPRPDRAHSTTAPVASAAPALVPSKIGPEEAAVEQVQPGSAPAPTLITSFDGLGAGFSGPQGTSEGRNPSDNSIAVGPDNVVQIVNSRMAIFTKQGKPLFGPVVTNTLFAGLGGPCEKSISGDAVVRYDQLAHRWLFVVPIFRKPSDQPDSTYGMCYALSTGPDPMGTYYRYEFKRPLFPDYPRPALWPDGYYTPSSTGDTVIQKHVCVADRNKMLQGLSASEQCVIVDGSNFLNASDLDGLRPPPAKAPNIIMADGGTQLHGIFQDDGIYFYKLSVNWSDPSKTQLSGPEKITVAPYHYLCNGQLNKCVPQPDTDMRLDSQGDKLVQRLVYRNFGHYRSIVASHSVDTKDGGGGVRWYEFRLDRNGTPHLFQQGTFAPGGDYRWLPSIAMDRRGDIGIGYSYGGATHFTGQRFVARLADDPKGQMTFNEAVLAEGEASQTNSLRWEDYTTLDIDPVDDCTFWYVGDFLKKGQQNYSTRIGAWSLPGCSGKRK
jgi:hypothetical protein